MMLIYYLFILIGGAFGKLMGLSSPWLSPHHTEDHDYDQLTPEDQMPFILNDGSAFEAVTGDDVVLDCDIVRLGEYSVIWQKEGKILWILQGDPMEPHIQYVIDNPRIGQVNTSLLIRNVTVKDEGEYSCELSTDSDKKIVHKLVVNVPPTVKPKDGIDYVQGKEGENLTFECQASGKPPPTISWQRLIDNRSIDDMASGNILTINNVTSSDSGLYACIGTNIAGGPTQTQFTLDIHHAPIVREQESVVHSGVNYAASILCIVDASPFPKVDWYKEGAPVNPMRLQKGMDRADKFSLHFEAVLREDFGFYSCNASNFYGNDSAVIELTGKPLVPKITSEPQGSFSENYTLTWEVKSYTPVTSYFVYLKNASAETSEEWVNITVPGNPSSSSMYHSQLYVLKDLSPGRSFITILKAINEFGESDFSKSFKFSTYAEDADMNIENESLMDYTGHILDSPEEEILENDFQNISTDNFIPEMLIIHENETNYMIKSIQEEGMLNVSSLGVPTLTSWEKRTQLMSFVTAISLSCFFSLFAMR